MTPQELLDTGKVAYTPAEVAAILGVDTRTVRRACADGQIPSFRVGKLVMIPRDGLLALLAGGGR